MGAFQFTWPHQAGQVFVTGNFDSWKGSVELKRDSESGLFTVSVDLGDSDKVYYKYIVDGNWTVNYDAKKEYDSSGNENNVLYPEDLHTPAPSIEEPESEMDTAPMQTPGLDDVPGGFPVTPAQEEQESEFPSVDPIPAGEPVPSIIAESTDDTVQESCEKADTEFAPTEEETPAAAVPEVVKESQAIADVSPEASADEVLVERKAELEQELIAEPPHLQHVEVEVDEEELVIAHEEPAEPLSEKIESEDQPPVTNGARSVSPTMSPLTTPAAPTTHVNTEYVTGATFASQKNEPAPSTRSSSVSSHNEKLDIFKGTPEKKKEKRRSVILGRILNFFK